MIDQMPRNHRPRKKLPIAARRVNIYFDTLQQKIEVARAARRARRTVSDFMRQAALEQARRMAEEEQVGAQ